MMMRALAMEQLKVRISGIWISHKKQLKTASDLLAKQRFWSAIVLEAGLGVQCLREKGAKLGHSTLPQVLQNRVKTKGVDKANAR